nr:MAG TPA: hypothetical protein [Caudoviricetes sp.]
MKNPYSLPPSNASKLFVNFLLTIINHLFIIFNVKQS